MKKRTPARSQNVQPIRKHYIPEWAEVRGFDETDFINEGGFDKSQVYRWWKGQLPRDPQLLEIAEFLNVDDPESLLRHPNDDWIRRLFHNKTEEQRAKMRQALELTWSDHKAG